MTHEKEKRMTRLTVDISMSLDGYVAGPHPKYRVAS
jgi:hypothetical protein